MKKIQVFSKKLGSIIDFSIRDNNFDIKLDERLDNGWLDSSAWINGGWKNSASYVNGIKIKKV